MTQTTKIKTPGNVVLEWGI